MSVSSFNPGVWVTDEFGNRSYYECPGWMYVLAFAVRGIEWAIKETETEQFKARIAEYRQQIKNQVILEQIENIERQLQEVKAELCGLQKQ